MEKICLIGPSKKFFGGVSAYTIRLANALSAKRPVSVLLLRNLLPRFLYPGKDHVGRQDYCLDFKPGIRVFEGMDWNSPWSWMQALRFLKREKPDIIILQWWTSSVAHLELLLLLINRWCIRAGIILEMHEIADPLEEGRIPLRWYSRSTGRLITGRADAVVVHSAATRADAIRAYRLEKNKVLVVPHGVYDSYFREYSRNTARKELGVTENFVLLYFGLIRKYKGIPSLVQAFNNLPPAVAGDSRLIIAGEDWGDEKDLGRIIRASPYSRQITFQAGFVPDSAVPKYFSAADVVMLPYLRTSGSGVASLAMAYGKPVIVSDLESTRDMLRGYQGAFFSPCGDPAGIAVKIEEAYAREKKRQGTCYHVPPGNHWDNITGEYLKLIEQIKPGTRK